jgi:hypothetical protein
MIVLNVSIGVLPNALPSHANGTRIRALLMPSSTQEFEKLMI